MDAVSTTTTAPTRLTRIRPGRRNAITQILLLQAELVKDGLNRKTTPSARSQVARAWSELEERKRILRMKPKPKDIDVDPRNDPRRKRRAVQGQIMNAAEPEPAALDVEAEPMAMPKPTISTTEVGKSLPSNLLDKGQQHPPQ